MVLKIHQLIILNPGILFLTTGSYFLWQNVYVYALPNTADLIYLVEKFNLQLHAVGKILRAYTIGMATDQYGSIVLDDTL